MNRIQENILESTRRSYRTLRAKLLSVGLRQHAHFDQSLDEAEASGLMSIIVPVGDIATQVLTRCLGSLEKYAPRAEVILVDDGSTRAELSQILTDYCDRNHWKTIRYEVPRGHSRATEAGAALATRPYLCLLNSDTIVTPWSWSGARMAFEMDRTIGITGPSTSHATTPQNLRSARYCRHYWTDSQVWAFARRQAQKYRQSGMVDLKEVGGFALFIRQDVWQSLGGFDETLPDYGNEMDLCRRAIKSGWKIVWTRVNYIHHLGGMTYQREKDESFSVPAYPIVAPKANPQSTI